MPPRARALLATLLILPATASLSGCGEGATAAGAARAFSADTIAGVLHLHTGGAPGDWMVEPLLRLGALEGGPEEFGSVRSVVASGDGRVYVADGLAREIRVFASDGRHLGTFGREGAGPGEFRNLVSLAWAGDWLAANDPGNARIQLFTDDGEAGETWSGTSTTGAPRVLRLRPAGNEEFYALGVRRDGESAQSVWVRHTRAGAADTLPPPPAPEGVTRGMTCHRSDGALAFFRFASSPELVFGFAPGSRVVSAWTDAYRIVEIGAAGDTSAVLTWSRPVVPIDDAAWREELKPFQEMRERFPGSTCEPSSPQRPDHRSTIREILHDETGRMWVEVATRAGFAWDVFSPGGEWIGTASLPGRDPRVSPYLRDGVFYQVEQDELDVQYVTAYRVRSPSAAGS